MQPTILATSLVALPGQLGHIFYFIVLPMLLLAGVGYLIQRKVPMDIPSLSRVYFYFAVPAMVYHSVVSSRIGGGDILKVLAFGGLLMTGMSVLTILTAWLRRVPRGQWNVMTMTTVFQNSGNYGLPLQELAFRAQGLGSAAMSLQIFVMLLQNFTSFTIGVFLASSGRKDRHWRHNLMQVVKFPAVYALAAALITVQFRNHFAQQAQTLADWLRPIWDALSYAKGAYIPIALCALGAQLAATRRAKESYPVTLSVVLRLLIGPALAVAIIYAMDLRGFLAQVLLIASTTPTAINVSLLCTEFDNHPDYATRSVYYSTLISPITVTAVVFLAQGGFLGQLAMP